MKKIMAIISLILAITFSLSIYTIRLGQEKFMENLKNCEPGIYNVIPVDIWYILISFGILLVGCLILSIALRYFSEEDSDELHSEFDNFT